jgi:HSP20 family protein
MHYNQSCAAKGSQQRQEQGYRGRHLHTRSMERAAVNIYKTETSFEMLVFAPGRIKENFHLKVTGNELTVSYLPPDNFPRPEWVRREYSRGGFERTFTLDETIDAKNISAKYEDGVLQVTLPVIAGKEATNQEIKVS